MDRVEIPIVVHQRGTVPLGARGNEEIGVLDASAKIGATEFFQALVYFSDAPPLP